MARGDIRSCTKTLLQVALVKAGVDIELLPSAAVVAGSSQLVELVAGVTLNPDELNLVLAQR